MDDHAPAFLVTNTSLERAGDKESRENTNSWDARGG